jgi:hypothetical protein
MTCKITNSEINSPIRKNRILIETRDSRRIVAKTTFLTARPIRAAMSALSSPATTSPRTARTPRTETPEDTGQMRAGIQSVEVGFALLEALSQASGALMLRDLASAARMSAAKAHRYLVSFQRMGLVMQDPVSTRYDLGPAALRLGLATLSRIDAVKLARDRVPALLAETGHTLAIAVWGNHGPTMVHWAEAPQTAADIGHRALLRRVHGHRRPRCATHRTDGPRRARPVEEAPPQ